MHRRVVVVINEEHYREIVFRIKATAHLFKLKDAFAKKVGLSRHSLQFKIGGVEIKDDDTAEKLQWKDYDKINVSRKQVRTRQKKEISRFEEQLQKLKETTRENLVKEIDFKKKDLEAYQQNKTVELDPIEEAMKTIKISMDKMINSLYEVKKLYLLEVEKKEAEIRIAESELEDFERSYKAISSMKKNFDCPVCYEFMEFRRIFQCSSGHLICENCKGRPEVRKCPVCRVYLGQYRENLSRNLAMEKLLGEYLGVEI